MLNHPIDVMIFSKDRPLQLDGLLRSMSLNIDKAKVSVLYHYEEEYASSINELKETHDNVTFIRQVNFCEQVKTFVDSSPEYCMFLVDDIVFKENVNTAMIKGIMDDNSNIMTFSLRLGLHLDTCYPLSSKQPVPHGTVYPPGVFVWEWKNSEMDWNYPLSVDGHVFRSNQFSSWISELQFSRPNSYEESLQLIRQKYPLPPVAVCHVRSKIVNLPLNRVQNDVENKCGDIDSLTLMKMWDEGKRMDIEKYQGVLNNGAHEELQLYITEG